MSVRRVTRDEMLGAVMDEKGGPEGWFVFVGLPEWAM